MGKPARDDGPQVDMPSVALALEKRYGKSAREIAEMLGVSLSTVYRWQAKAAELGAAPPPDYAFRPRVDCKCAEQPIKMGEKLVCVNCCASGWDFHPAMHGAPLPKDKKPPAPDEPGGKGGKKARRQASPRA